MSHPGPYKYNNYNKTWLLYPLHKYHNSKLKDRLKELAQPCYIQNNSKRRYTYIVLVPGKSYLIKKHLNLPKSSLKPISSKWSSLWLITYLLWLMDVFWNRQSVFPRVHSVLLFSLACSFIRIRQTSYSPIDPLISRFAI